MIFFYVVALNTVGTFDLESRDRATTKKKQAQLQKVLMLTAPISQGRYVCKPRWNVLSIIQGTCSQTLFLIYLGRKWEWSQGQWGSWDTDGPVPASLQASCEASWDSWIYCCLPFTDHPLQTFFLLLTGRKTLPFSSSIFLMFCVKRCLLLLLNSVTGVLPLCCLPLPLSALAINWVFLV